MNHYDWCNRHFEALLRSLGSDIQAAGLLSAHGDKAYGYRTIWIKAGVPFNHGVALYLLSYIAPWEAESRVTPSGWVPVSQWVIDNYERFKPHMANA